MKLDHATDLIGRPVRYTPPHGAYEVGVVTSVRGRYVFVRFGTDEHSKAVDPIFLEVTEDGTAIDIEFDPLARRMVGTAIHGNTPFDVPFMTNIWGNLWQGGCTDGLVLPDHIDRVVSLYPWEKYTVRRADVEVLEVPMFDSTSQGFGMVDVIAAGITANLADHPTLVHCQAGLNRSSLIAARVLMMHDKFTAREAVDTIREKRSPACLCNPSFLKWLLAHDD